MHTIPPLTMPLTKVATALAGMTMPYIHSKASVCICTYTSITLKPQEVHSECHMCSVMANTAKLHQRRQATKSADMALIWQ